MLRTALFSAALSAIIALNWARLEQPRPSLGSLVLMVALGIAPALLPSRRWRRAPARRLAHARGLAPTAGPPGPSANPCRHGACRARPDRVELGCRRQGPVPRLAELGLLQQAQPPTERRVHLELELQRRPFPEEADARLHRPRAGPVRVLARDNARRILKRSLARGPDHGEPVRS